MIAIGSEAKGHFRLLMLAFVVSLLALGAYSPRSAHGNGSAKEVTGSKVYANLTSRALGVNAASQKSSGKKSSGKKSSGKKAKGKRSSGKRNQAAARLEQLSRLPWPENVSKLAGSGAVLVLDNHVGRGGPKELFALNADTPYVPASILKLVTAAAALETLGPGFEFRTDFALGEDGGLWVVGRGDPFLVSEELCLAAENLTKLGLKEVGNVYLDTTYFEPDLVLDGNTFTSNPYDAYNGALGINFNTVSYLIDKGGRVVESDKCTPVTPITLELAQKNKKVNKKTRAGSYRLNISDSPRMAEEQSGLIIKALLEKYGVTVTGEVILGGKLPASATPLYSHVNSRNLEGMLVDVLEYSNNYMTNQIFLIMGAEAYGAPATMEKGRQAVFDFLERRGLPRLTMVEGSGLSRNNQVTARQMSEVLSAFEPNLRLAKASKDGSVYYKTGTMSDIQTLAGYMLRPGRPDEPLWFVILLNGVYDPGTREKILSVLKAHFIDEPAAAAGG
ncbi:MAG: D-alanyl-D-alanine carboxypeptidase [Deltaproteobacteria bacterium]|jgi:D-alanyl-D-alanine carboxypeptidase/D-alanyl-D-alanine-endopeptidase (penicillin-binding protein 4)|nr:D-alanyl-D-alanine carboxypeptidase [Deltaproteobacteria bacterium]